MPSVINAYCTRLSINPPVLEDFAARQGVKSFHLVMAALLENGRPMSVDDLAGRLLKAGATSRIGDLRHSIRKAWHGQQPVVLTPDGRFDLNLSWPETLDVTPELIITSSTGIGRPLGDARKTAAYLESGDASNRGSRKSRPPSSRPSAGPIG